jgi:hypothetical protein
MTCWVGEIYRAIVDITKPVEGLWIRGVRNNAVWLEEAVDIRRNPCSAMPLHVATAPITRSIYVTPLHKAKTPDLERQIYIVKVQVRQRRWESMKK